MKSLRIPQLIYLLLFMYVVAALLFWGFSLQKQSTIIYEAERRALPFQIDSLKQPAAFRQKLSTIEAKRVSRTKQYYGEGTTFLLIILVGAAVVYSAIRRRLRLSRQQSNFMMAVTHELKSPIAAMKLNLQTMQRRRNLPEEQQSMLLERCVAESNRLNDLCNNLLVASQLEGQQYRQAFEIFPFHMLVQDAVKDYSTRYPDRFAAQLDAECEVKGDTLLLQMAVNNLLENAVKYSPAGSRIQVTLRCKGERVFLQVADDGVGIPAEEKGRIFEKFYRVGNESTRSAKGTGLGLYITKRIMKEHRGEIVVRDNLHQGSVFELELPVV